MATELDKENIAEGLTAGSSIAKPPALSPKKNPGKKTRSKSIGPGGLGELDAPLKESTGNRRKSAFIPAVKSILASNDEDEKKRRDERRKSLARRRVSFAPEATLHTWDVVEYLRDATTSSASSGATRRASSVSQASNQDMLPSSAASPAPDSDPVEPPSTPPEQVEDVPLPGSSPANQRSLHQKKRRRRSSVIPPMNFNNPDDEFSSSPYSGSSSISGSDGIDGSSEDEGEDTMTKMDSLEAGRHDSGGGDSNDSSETSARLEAALRQAAAHAGTQRLDLDENGEMSMEIVDEEITAAFKPWAKKTADTPRPTRMLSSSEDQENMDPFSPAVRPQKCPKPSARLDDPKDEDAEDMSMDITRAIGKIIPRPISQSPERDDATMDLTLPLGKIQQSGAIVQEDRRKSLKRRQSSMAGASQGSPAKRPAGRRSSIRRRRSSAEESSFGDETMDLTVAIGGIQNGSVNKGPESQDDGSLLGDDTMDFTMVVGGIKGVQAAKDRVLDGQQSEDDEELSMEFTNVIGSIKGLGQQSTPVKPTVLRLATPVKAQTPRKSPGRPRLSDVLVAKPSPSPIKGAKSTPQKSPGRPRKSLAPATPNSRVTPQKQTVEPEPSPFITRPMLTPSKNNGLTSTPQDKIQSVEPLEIPDDPVAAPILNRRRSSLSNVQFSPIPPTTREEQPLKSTSILSNSIKLLSTPRKQTLASPVKRGATPKSVSTPKKTPTPKKAKTPTPKKSASPKKRVVFGIGSPVKEVDEGLEEELLEEEEEEDVERISLQDFLEMTNIRFMDLTTTKRRHTAAPTAFFDRELEDKEDTLENYVVASACTVPEYEMYQHACHELKRYISGGRDHVRQIEAAVYEDNPTLFSEYLSAPLSQRSIMETQFKNLKTFARLQSKMAWYEWRSRLLSDLMPALLKTKEDLMQDEAVFTRQEGLLDAVLPSLTEQHERFEVECKQLQQRHDELNSCDREELEAAREQLSSADAEIVKKRRLIASLQEELQQKEAHIDAVKDRKVECAEEIKAAERVREECRGWSASEVNSLKAQVTALEESHKWSITSASASTITMLHLNDLELYFHPAAFNTGSSDGPNAPISLTYIGDSTSPHSRPLTTSKRFFLQLIRAHLHCVPQSQTRIADLLLLIKNSWAAALAVAEGVRWLDMSYMTEESILSDERMAVSASMLLPSLQTKVRITFDIGVNVSVEGVETQVMPRAGVMYGEKYKEDRMRDFLTQAVGEKLLGVGEMTVWADAVEQLAGMLRKRGRKE